MNEYLRQSFEEFSGIDMDKVVEYKELDFTRVQVTLRDGSRYLYNSGGTYVRRLPKDPKHLTDHEFRSEFGRRLQEIMYFKCITQQELADRTGLSQPQINNYINGKNTPSFRVVDLIAKAIGCSTDDLRYF